MKEVVKEHPLRPIILRFDPDKPQLEFETKGLSAHYLMHDLTWEAQQKLRKLNEQLGEIDIKIAELEYYLFPIEQDLDILEVFLKIKDPSVLPLNNFDEEIEITIDINELFSSITDHNQQLRDLHSEVSTACIAYEQHYDMIYEKESWIDEQLWKDVHQIYVNYLNVKVDIVSLDRDQEEFREVLSDVFDYQYKYYDYFDLILSVFKTFQKRCDKSYRRAEVVDKGLKELRDNMQ
ncbi:hypothetical protein [Sphingobacterium detergens]|uniref:Uncharacterized protein n=1 Tax=Sphingobacterium detergens TaxID=1145106 RepID=A0A420BIZ6_SPHD1|nr:hypothetical protein [Sphingobacterium detergens]RKE56670.1 hypothetical protein DFQ12_1536 [Sphingobacterium detergens]